MPAVLRIGLDLHNLSIYPDSVRRTGIQEVIFNLFKAQAELRGQLTKNDVQIIPLPYLPKHDRRDDIPGLQAVHVLPTEPVLVATERELGLSRKELWGDDFELKSWTNERYYNLCKDLDWIVITGLCEFRHVIARGRQRNPNLKFATLTYDLAPIIARYTCMHGMPEWYESSYVQSILMGCKLLFTISRHTAIDADRFFNGGYGHGLPVVSTPLPTQNLAIKPADVRQIPSLLNKHGLSARKYFVCLGTIEPRKNLEVAVKGFARFLELFPEQAKSWRLVMIGLQGWGETSSSLEPLVAQHPDKFIKAGYLPSQEVELLVAGAGALVMPSRYEGYGMPLALARALGTEVVTCINSSLPEAAGTDAYFVRPNHVDELALVYHLITQRAEAPLITESEIAALTRTISDDWQGLLLSWLDLMRKADDAKFTQGAYSAETFTAQI